MGRTRFLTPEAGGPTLEAVVSDPGGAWVLSRGHSSGRDSAVLVLHVRREDEGAPPLVDTLRRLWHPGLARVLLEDRAADASLLLLEDPGGPPLSSLVGAPADRVLIAAEAMAAGLAALHASGHVHGRLGPEAWMLDAAGVSPVLVDVTGPSRPVGPEEPWTCWRAPEQASSPGDVRADVYALGAVLHWLLLGRPPYQHDDPLVLRQLVLAGRLPPVAQAAPGLPEPVARLVERLLAADPGARLPSAAAATAAIARARAGLRTGPRLLAGVGSAVIVGRAGPRATLLDALARATAGENVRVRVLGPAGVGKTSLVETLRAPTLARGGSFGLGRVDPARGPRALGALAGALEEVAGRLLAGDAARLERARRAVARALGPNAALVGALGPRLRWLVAGAAGSSGPPTGSPVQPGAPAPPIGVAATAARRVDAVERLVVALAAAETPLVLALDDLHRADAETHAVLRALAGAPDAEGLLLLLAWRPEELVDALPDDPGALRVDLDGLDAPAVAELVTHLLGDFTGDTGALARLVHARTGGNPFFARAFLEDLVSEGALRAGDQGCEVDLGLATAVDARPGVVELVARRLAALSPLARDVLAAGARLGEGFPAALVAEVLSADAADVGRALDDAAAAGAVARHPQEPGAWRFLHDRLQQAALDLVEGPAAEALHARLGALLCARLGESPEPAELLRAVHHLDQAGDRVAVAERVRWDLRAAVTARETGAFGAALAFADAGLRALGDDPWRVPEAAPLHLEAARAAVVAAPARLDALVGALLAHATDDLVAAEAIELQVDLHLARAEPALALEATRAAAARLGWTLPARVGKPHVVLALLRARLALGRRGPLDLHALPEVKDPRRAALLRVLLRGSTAAFLADPDLFAWLCCEMVRLGLASGACPGTAWGLLVFAILLGAVGEADRGYEVGQTAMEMLGRHAPQGLEAKARSVWVATQLHTRLPLRDTLAPLRDAWRIGLGEGDALHAGVNVAFYVNHLVFSGEPLDHVLEEVRRYEGELRKRGLTLPLATLAPFAALARTMAEGAPPPAEPPPADQPYACFSAAFCRLVAAVLAKDDEDALAWAARAEAHLLSARGTVNEGLFWFYAGVAAGRRDDAPALLRRARRALRPRALRNREAARRLRLLDALADARAGRLDRALAGLDEAARVAHEAGAPHEAGLALETLAILHARAGAEGTAALVRAAAVEAWRAWGARPLVAAAGAHVLPPPPARHGPGAEVALRAAERLAGEVGRDDLLAALLRLTALHTGAERVVLLGSIDGDLVVFAALEGGEAAMARGAATVQGGTPLARYPRACAAAARLVARTGEPLVEARADRPEAFGDDPWVVEAGLRSVAAIPVFLRGALSGVVLLEHAGRAGAFDDAGVVVARALATIASPLVENAALLAALELRAAELRDANHALAAHGRLLEDTVRLRTAELDALTRLQASVLDALWEGVCGLDAGGRVTFANPAAGRILGHDPATLVGRPFHAAFHLADPAGPCPLCDATAAAQDVVAEVRGAGGRVIPVECAVQPVPEVPGARVLSFRDTSRRLALEERLRQGQKLEAIGRFVGGVAHEFNNLLTPVLANLELTRKEARLDTGTRERLAGVEDAALRAADLVRQLLAYGRRSDLVRQPTDLAAVVRDGLRFVRPSLDRRAEIVEDVPADGAWAIADAGQVHQVLLNLLLNARDAVRDVASPRVEVSVRALPADAGPGLIELVVADNGHGMPPAVLARLFEPFFTTKPPGEGSGLGLGVVQGIVQQHGGAVVVTSAQGEGTRVACTFPASAGRHGLEASLRMPVAPDIGAARVLVVDDDALVRDVARAVLEEEGYLVEEAPDGPTAIARLTRAPEPDVVLLDIVMPGMDGWTTLTALRAQVPDLPVIVWSGFDQSGEEVHGARPDARLPKPFRMRELLSTIERVRRRE